MDTDKIYHVNKELWKKEGSKAFLLCSKDNCLTPMREKPDDPFTIKSFAFEDEKSILICPQCGNEKMLSSSYSIVQQDIMNIIRSKQYKKMQIIDIDGISTPIAKAKVKSKDDKYFVTAQLMESKRGLQLAVYAGEKGSSKKTQIFIEPEVKRLAFDQKDLHPGDVFVELKATFDDGSTNTIEKKGKA